MSENETCAICGRPIIWISMRDGSRAACDPTRYLLSDLPLDAKNAPNLTTLITDEGVAIKKEFVYPGTERDGYMPHFYTCDTAADKSMSAVLLMDRKWLGDSSVAPATEFEGGFGDGGELE